MKLFIRIMRATWAENSLWQSNSAFSITGLESERLPSLPGAIRDLQVEKSVLAGVWDGSGYTLDLEDPSSGTKIKITSNIN